MKLRKGTRARWAGKPHRWLGTVTYVYPKGRWVNVRWDKTGGVGTVRANELEAA